MGNDETGISSEELKSANEFYSQCEKRDPRWCPTPFFAIIFIQDDLKNQKLPEEQYREKIGSGVYL